jgi:two-component system, OmpR family, sensor kinase
VSRRWRHWVRRLLSRGLGVRLGVPLRLRVLAGVVAVTLLALAAFDIGAVTLTRRSLLTQTDNNLTEALTVTEPKLTALLAEGVPAPSPARDSSHARPPGDFQESQLPRPLKITPRAQAKLAPALVGAYEIAFVPRRGPAVILEMGAETPGDDQFILLSSNVVRSLAQPGLQTAPIGPVAYRILSAPVQGGSLLVGTSLAQVTQTTQQVEVIVVIGSLAVVLLIGIGVFFVMRRGLRPIEAMARQADRISGGDLTDRVATHDPRSEVGRLGAALNGMLARLEASQQQMRRFFADASHELRTPLASLRANAQLSQQGALRSPDEVDEVMDRIVVETRRMGQLVDDMLRLARLGQRPCQAEAPVDVTAVLTGCAERAQAADPARSWQVRIATGVKVTGDEELLRRAIDNLLMNVLVHTPADTTGTISVTAAGGCVTIEVSDDGPGVPPEHLPHILERFYRAGPRSDGSSSGSGLGLAIAAEIATACGGTLRAAPVSPHGLQVTLTLPIRPGQRTEPKHAISIP